MDSLLLFNHLKPEADALNKFSGKILMLLPNTETSKLPSVLFLDCFKCQPDFIWILPHTASDLAFISLTFFPRKFRLRRDFLRRVGKVKCLLSKQSYFFICQRRLQRVPSEAASPAKSQTKFFFGIFFCLLRYLLGFVKQREESVHLLNHTVPSKAPNG